ncbi:MAG: PAS domain S-box protein, partial [Thermoanaerobaculia bacterium]|nr:PAS domain S-box protein [Thermoanaerobaculia bacterium]
LGGHPFALTIVARPGFLVTQGSDRSRDLLAAGLLVTGLLFGIMWSLSATKARALTLAEKMTASLRTSEERYGRLFEQSLAGIYRTTPEGRILECNEAFARLYGYESRLDLLDHSAVALYESAESREQFLDALRMKGTLAARESRSRRKDGSLFWTLEHASLLPGPPEVIEGTIVDISERKETEEALRQSRERYRHVIETSREGLLFFDLATRRILETNPALQRMLGYSAPELSSRTLDDIAVADRATIDADLHRLAGLKTLTFDDAVYRRKDGTGVAVAVAAVLVEEGARQIVFNAVKNLSETQHLEAQLRQAQKMEAVGRLAGGVAHDFNNLLTAILGYAELLLDSDPTDDVRSSADEIRKAGERAASLTKQLLAFSRKQVLQPKVLDLNEVLAEVDGILRRVLGEDIALEAERDPHLWRVMADPGQIQQVLLNLAVNSRDAMPEGGVLRIATRNASLRDASLPEVPNVAEGDYVLLEVADTGHGMDAGTLSHAFEPFFTTKERGKGTGLGLSTVYGIVKQSGGYVHIESEPGKGTRVLVYLARVHGAADSPSNVTPRSLPRGGTETILLVEDEESVRRLASLVLERSGYRLLVASTAEEALETARGYSGQIDLLLTDVVLPGLNGRRLADLLGPERPAMKVVFASGYFDERGILEPGSDFIPKPFNPETLARTIRRALDRKPA